MAWDPASRVAGEVTLLMVEQSSNPWLRWAKCSWRSVLIYEDVLWYSIHERGAKQQPGPLRAGLNSATALASGRRYGRQRLQ